MKGISEYINTCKLDYLDSIVLEHCYVSYAFNNEGHSECFTFESLGLFKGCREIVDYIVSNFEKLHASRSVTIKSSDISGLANSYFGDLHLCFSKDNAGVVHGEYEIGYLDDERDDKYEKSRWDNAASKFNFIKIALYNCELGSESDIAEILTHELMHSWDDYILHTKSYDSLRNRNLSNALKHEFETIKKNLKENKVICLLSMDFEKMKEYDDKLRGFGFVEKLIYYLDKFEVNAYVAQVNQTLRGKHFDNVKDAIEFITKESASYYNYKCIYDLAFAENGNVFLEHGATKAQLRKIQKLASKAWRKIVNHTYHACIDSIERKLNEGSSTVKISDLTTKIWKRHARNT